MRTDPHLRTRLKLKNLGSPAIPLLRRELQALQKAGFVFCTVREYVRWGMEDGRWKIED